MEIYTKPVVHIRKAKTGTTIFPPNGLAFDPDHARDLIMNAADGLPPLLSDERLSGTVLAGGLHGMVPPEMARRIKAMFPDARIVIGIRAQPDMLAASYSQYVKSGGTFGVKRFLFPDSYFYPGAEYRAHAPRFDLAHFDYQRLIRFYYDLFGSENVQIVLFEHFRRAPIKCAKALADKLGLAVDEARISEGVRNPGLNRNALTAMRIYNSFTARRTRDKWFLVHIPGLFEVRKKLHRRLNSIFRRKSSSSDLLGPETMAWIQARFAPSNRELGQMLGIDLGALGYPVAMPDQPPPSPLPRGRKLRAT
jgi:hypothetical protein